MNYAICTKNVPDEYIENQFQVKAPIPYKKTTKKPIIE